MKQVTFNFEIVKIGTSKGIIIPSYFIKLDSLSLGDVGEALLKVGEK